MAHQLHLAMNPQHAHELLGGVGPWTVFKAELADDRIELSCGKWQMTQIDTALELHPLTALCRRCEPPVRRH